ncbi:hypothetical protein SHIRM173S_08256 [Streptomyces hirsutus]
MATEEELFASVDALLEEEPQLPSPAERARLREAAGITQARLAAALKTSTQSVKNWENGRSEPNAASGKPQPGGFRLGPTPGLAKLEGVRSMLWAVGRGQAPNPARHIKGGDAVLDEGE